MASSGQIDLRSDTVTQPSPAMRQAMAQAKVGDDVLGEDPTVAALEARCAELSGKSAALFVPSGTMANLIACRTHTRPGDEVILERGSHLYRYEAGGFAAVGGCSVAPLVGDRGQLQPEQVSGALRPADIHTAESRLLWLENTHNYGGGSCYTLASLRTLRHAAQQHGLALHIDGARVWNAMANQGYTLAQIANLCDSMSFCFSKGLGCPVGSMLVGSRPFVNRARKLRKMLGGGMRQAGILAAAALYALDHHIQRIHDDHRRAQELANALAKLSDVKVEPVETNIIFVKVEAPQGAHGLCRRLAASGILTLALDGQRLRFVTHLDINDSAIERVCERLSAVAHG